MDKLSLRELSLQGKKVLMRVDFNVPLDVDLKIEDPTRIEAALPSIKYIIDQGGSVILISHLGRPHGQPYPPLSLKPCGVALSGLTSQQVKMASDCVGEDVDEMKAKLKPGEILLLENLRFHRAEEHPDETLVFSRQLATHADYYVNDAFACSHRKHASITELPKLFPGKSAAGFLLEKEVIFLSKALTNPDRPFHAIIGGAKVSTKMGVIKALLEKADCLLIGGGMAFTFFKAQGKEIGDSPYEPELLEMARSLLDLSAKNRKLVLPVDVVCAEEISGDVESKIIDVEQGIPAGYQGLDIGPKTISLFCEKLKNAKSVIWNGPLGVYEIDPFAKGTREVAEFLKNSTATTVIGGGNLISAINEINLLDAFAHVSTGGGATLEFIEQGTLPGIEALSPKEQVQTHP